MERPESFTAAESRIDTESEIKLAVASLLRVHAGTPIPHESLRDAPEMVDVCPRLVCPQDFLVAKNLAHFVIHDDTTVDVGRNRVVLSPAHIVVLNELMVLQESASIRHFAALFCTPQEDPFTLPLSSGRILKTRRILDELMHILGDDVVWRDHIKRHYVYHLSDDVGVYDARIELSQSPQPLPSAILWQAPPQESEVAEPLAGEWVVNSQIWPEPTRPLAAAAEQPAAGPETPDMDQPADNQGEEVPAEMPLVAPAVPTTDKAIPSVADLEGTDTDLTLIRVTRIPGDPTPTVSEAWRRRERLRWAQEGGEWHDAESIAYASGQPLEIVEKFIEYTREQERFKEYAPPQRRNKIVNGRRIGRVTEHFSPKFYAYALANLPRFRAALEAWQAKQGL